MPIPTQQAIPRNAYPSFVSSRPSSEDWKANLSTAVSSGDQGKVQALLQGRELSAHDIDLMLKTAALCGQDMRMKQALLDASGIDPHAALRVAVRHGDAELADAMLKQGADINRIPQQLHRPPTPAMHAVLSFARYQKRLYPSPFPAPGETRLDQLLRSGQRAEAHALLDSRMALEGRDAILPFWQSAEASNDVAVLRAMLLLGYVERHGLRLSDNSPVTNPALRHVLHDLSTRGAGSPVAAGREAGRFVARLRLGPASDMAERGKVVAHSPIIRSAERHHSFAASVHHAAVVDDGQGVSIRTDSGIGLTSGEEDTASPQADVSAQAGKRRTTAGKFGRLFGLMQARPTSKAVGLHMQRGSGQTSSKAGHSKRTAEIDQPFVAPAPGPAPAKELTMSDAVRHLKHSLPDFTDAERRRQMLLKILPTMLSQSLAGGDSNSIHELGRMLHYLPDASQRAAVVATAGAVLANAASKGYGDAVAAFSRLLPHVGDEGKQQELVRGAVVGLHEALCAGHTGAIVALPGLLMENGERPGDHMLEAVARALPHAVRAGRLDAVRASIPLLMQVSDRVRRAKWIADAMRVRPPAGLLNQAEAVDTLTPLLDLLPQESLPVVLKDLAAVVGSAFKRGDAQSLLSFSALVTHCAPRLDKQARTYLLDAIRASQKTAMQGVLRNMPNNYKSMKKAESDAYLALKRPKALLKK